VVPHIVIVHGDERERTLLGSILKERGYTVKALDAGASVEDFSQSTPDCILIQHCPDRGSCTELVRVIRQRRELADVPVIMLSSGAKNNELAEVLDAGANVFLLNPFGESELIALLQSQLRTRENSAGLKQQLERTQQALVRLQADLLLGQQVLSSLLPPHSLRTENFSLEARLIAGGDLSGDYFDYRLISPDQLVLFLADVSGHGVASALLASRLKALFDKFQNLADSPRAFMEQLNLEIINLGEHYHIATAVSVFIDVKKQIARYASAGHRTVYWLDREGNGTVTLPATGPALGMFEEFDIDEAVHNFTSGRNRLVAFTDGLVEFRRSDGGWVTETDFRDSLLLPYATLPLESYVATLLQGSSKLAGHQKWDDDVSLFAVDF